MNADPEWNWSLVGPGLLLEWLQAWVTFNSYNDEPGSAEHGITFSSNADAGWTIEIGMAGTELEGRAFDGLDGRTTGVTDIQVVVDERAFRMSCGATELSAALGGFMAWARPSSRPAEMDEEWCLYEADNFPMGWLQTWFAQHCNGTWEREHSIQFQELDNPGWSFEVDLGGTELAGHPVARTLIERSAHDWLSIQVEGDRYLAYAGPLNLGEAIAAFRDWADSVVPGETR